MIPGMSSSASRRGGPMRLRTACDQINSYELKHSNQAESWFQIRHDYGMISLISECS